MKKLTNTLAAIILSAMSLTANAQEAKPKAYFNVLLGPCDGAFDSQPIKNLHAYIERGARLVNVIKLEGQAREGVIFGPNLCAYYVVEQANK